MISIRHYLGLSFCIILFAKIKINIYFKIRPSLLPSIYLFYHTSAHHLQSAV